MEIKTFARNPGVARDAKSKYGCKCQACGFDFERTYGEIGKNFIECVRLDPFSSRPEATSGESSATTLDRVAVLCANCRRMRHRRTPPLSVEDLRGLIEKSTRATG
jgi:5-methylcytosine-specific restriction protein A